MDSVQLLANGGIVTVLGGILYAINERRIKSLEGNKSDKSICDERHGTLNATLEKIDSRLEVGNIRMQDLQIHAATSNEQIKALNDKIDKLMED